MRKLFIVLLGLAAMLALLSAGSVQAQPVSPCNPCITYCSYTQGAWGAPCHDNNAGCIRNQCFSAIYPNGVTIGRNYPAGCCWIHFTSSQAIQDFLPQGNPSVPLTHNYTDPGVGNITVFAGQVLALQLNVDYGNYGCNGMVPIGGMIIASGPFAGWTISAFLAAANDVLGGGPLPGGLTIDDFNDAASALNLNFDNCVDNDHYVIVPPQGGTTVIRYPDVTDPIGDDLPVSACLTFTPQCEDICLIWWCNGCNPTDFANFTVVPGCSGPNCSSTCEPSTGILTGLDYASQQILENIPGDGCWWYATVHATAPGCFCVTMDFQLPVTLVSFEAIPGNGQVRLAWSTATETDNNYFEILRDHVKVAEVNSEGTPASGANYTWTDRDVTNGTNYDYALVSVDAAGNRQTIATGAARPAAPAVVTEFALYQNYPNPFNPSTTIGFDIPESGHVSLAVFDVTGRLLATLVDRDLSPDRYTVSFDATSLSSGTYFYRLEAGRFTATHKMLILK